MRHKWYFRKWMPISGQPKVGNLEQWSNEIVVYGDYGLKAKFGLEESKETHRGWISWLVKRFFWRRIVILEIAAPEGTEFRLVFTAACGVRLVMPCSIVHKVGRRIALRAASKDLRLSAVSNNELFIVTTQITNLGSRTAHAKENADVVIY